LPPSARTNITEIFPDKSLVLLRLLDFLHPPKKPMAVDPRSVGGSKILYEVWEKPGFRFYLPGFAWVKQLFSQSLRLNNGRDF
jgi:hypothetical protein